ncbi:unnamed protein product [Malus baccata var. baccata]
MERYYKRKLSTVSSDNVGSSSSDYEADVNLVNQKNVVINQSDQDRMAYDTCLNVSINCIKFLLRQDLYFFDYCDSVTSSNRGNYLELFQFIADHNEKVKPVVLENAPKDLNLLAPSGQKNLVNSCAIETIDAIMSDVKDKFFSILVGESRDFSTLDQIAIVLRYVDKKGEVIERFVGVQLVGDITSSNLKETIDSFFSFNKLSFSKLRGQSYDGTSNMKEEFSDLKTKIMSKQPCAFYVHCFAQNLEICLVAAAKKNVEIASFFTYIISVVNLVGAFCHRPDALGEQLHKELKEAFGNDFLTERGMIQETSLKHTGDANWNSYYGVLLNLISMFSSVVEVLELIVDDCCIDSVGEACRTLKGILSFEFVFHLFFMRSILEVTNVLSLALQKKDKEIVVAMDLVKSCKQQLRHMRNSEFDLLVDKVSSFCIKHDIENPSLDETRVVQGRSRRNAPLKTNRQFYAEVFFCVIDEQLMELGDRFNEVNTELLVCLACLNPDNFFIAFDKQKLLRLAQFYPQDFSDEDLFALEGQLGLYIQYMRSSSDFSQLQGISNLAKKMLEKGMHRKFNYVYLLITLALVLPVATASVERAFSAMKVGDGSICNRMGDQWLRDSLVIYIEKDVFGCIDNEALMLRFHNMKTRVERL